MKRITCDRENGSGTGRARAWLKLLAGACILLFMAAVFSSGYTPPGFLGEVVRHNQQADIDASPFFYGDVDNMMELIEGAEQWWWKRSSNYNENRDKTTETVDQEE